MMLVGLVLRHSFTQFLATENEFFEETTTFLTRATGASIKPQTLQYKSFSMYVVNFSSLKKERCPH